MPPAPWLDIEVAAQSAEPTVYCNMSGLSAAIAMIDHARLLAVITTGLGFGTATANVAFSAEI
jgi:hypothetical protein